MLTGLTVAWSGDELLSVLEREGVPCGPINSVAAVFKDPQVIARGLRVDLAAPEARGGTIPSVASPIVLDRVRQVAERASPSLGQDDAALAAGTIWPEAGEESTFEGMQS